MDTKVSEVMGPVRGEPYHITPTAKVMEAAKTMEAHKVSCLLVIDDEDRLTGIITERDLRNFVASNRMADAILVGQIMTPATLIKTVEKTDPLEHALSIMTEKDIRHVPVTNNGVIVGILSQRDVAKFALNMWEHLERRMA